MAGYVRQSTADIIPTATVRAAPINAEYNALRDAFAASGGHKHDGTSGEGEYVPLIADLDALNKVVIDTTNNRVGVFVEVSAAAVEQIRIQDGVIVPVTDNDIDLGTSSVEFKDLYLDGTAYIDTLAVHESATITSNFSVNGNTTLGNAASDTVTFTADIASAMLPSADNTHDLGAVGSEWRNLYIDGTANIDALIADTATISAGTIDNTVIGGSTAVAGSFTTISSSGATTLASLTVSGATALNGGLTLDTNKFTVADTTGNTAIAGTLDVTGATTVADFTATGTTVLPATSFGDNNITNVGNIALDSITADGSSITITGNTTFADGAYDFDVASHDGSNGLKLAGTLVTSSAAELNKLDGATVTTTEINILDGDTSATSTTVADADRVVMNDNGTMVQVAVTDLAAYFDDEITAMPNLVTTAATTVGALNSGSITSGFGSIDTGSSTITTTGNITGGNVIISDGGNIGSASDTDAIAIASNGNVTLSQNLTVSGDLQVDGTTTTVNSNNLSVDDQLIELGNGRTGSATGDSGIVIERGSDANAFIGFDESADKFTVGTGTFTGTSTGDLSITTGTLVANIEGNVTGDLTGNADTATALETARTIAGQSFDGTANINIATTDLTSVTATAAEVNIMDGDTAATSTTLADADRVVVNDAGTMKQVALTDFETYFESALDTLSNVTTVGTLNSGSITSGFGSIDNGSSAITTTGTITFGTLSDGSDSVTDIVTSVGSGSANSELPTALAVENRIQAINSISNNVSGLNATGAELNAVADVSAITIDTSTAIANNDGIAVFDSSASAIGYFDVDLLDTYFAGTTKTLTNKTLTSPTVSGLYLSDAGFIVEGSSADGNETTVTFTDPTADRTITFPNATGTVALSGATQNVDFGTVTADGLVVDTDTLYVDSANDRVGVGTTNPDADLHISGSGNDAKIIIEGAANPRGNFIAVEGADDLVFAADEDNLGAASSMQFRVDATEAMRIDSSQRVLIGLSSARTNFNNGATTPSGLQIEGTVTSSQASITANRNDVGGPLWYFGKTRGTTVGSNTVVQDDDQLGGVVWQGADGTDLVSAAQIRAYIDGAPGNNDMPARIEFSTTSDAGISPTERMRIGSTGKVTIQTPASGTALEVNVIDNVADGFVVQQGSNKYISVDTTNTNEEVILGNATTNPSVVVKGTNLNINSAYIDFSGSITTPSTAAAIYRPADNTLAFSTANTEAMRIDSSQRVLIGHTSSIAIEGGTQNLQLIGTTSNDGLSIARFNADFGPYFNFGRSGSGTIGTMTAVPNGDELGRIQWAVADGTDMTSVGASISAFTEQLAASNDVPSRLVFSTTLDGASSPSERMRIDNAGNVGINTTTPSSYTANGNNLVVADVNVGITLASTSTVGSGALYFADGTSGSQAYRGIINYLHSSDAMGFHTGAAQAMTIDSSQRVLIGLTSDLTGTGHKLQLNSDMTIMTFDGTTTGANGVRYIKSRATSPGSNAIVADGDDVGFLDFRVDDGTDYASRTAVITSQVDGTPGVNDTPGRLVFYTTADGASAVTERMRISNDGNIVINTVGAKLYFQNSSGPAPYIQNAGTNNSDLTIATNGSEAMRIDSSQRVLIGATASRTVQGFTHKQQIEGTNASTASLSIVRNTNSVDPPYITFGKTRSGSVGGSAIVQQDDVLGRFDFTGANGSNLDNIAVRIDARVDGAPGSSSDMPGRIVFQTSADGTASPTERVRITNAGAMGFDAGSASIHAMRVGTSAGSATDCFELDLPSGTFAAYVDVVTNQNGGYAGRTSQFLWYARRATAGASRNVVELTTNSLGSVNSGVVAVGTITASATNPTGTKERFRITTQYATDTMYCIVRVVGNPVNTLKILN